VFVVILVLGLSVQYNTCRKEIDESSFPEKAPTGLFVHSLYENSYIFVHPSVHEFKCVLSSYTINWIKQTQQVFGPVTGTSILYHPGGASLSSMGEGYCIEKKFILETNHTPFTMCTLLNMG
jgi:hypothetical protein